MEISISNFENCPVTERSSGKPSEDNAQTGVAVFSDLIASIVSAGSKGPADANVDYGKTEGQIADAGKNGEKGKQAFDGGAASNAAPEVKTEKPASGVKEDNKGAMPAGEKTKTDGSAKTIDKDVTPVTDAAGTRQPSIPDPSAFFSQAPAIFTEADMPLTTESPGDISAMVPQNEVPAGPQDATKGTFVGSNNQGRKIETGNSVDVNAKTAGKEILTDKNIFEPRTSNAFSKEADALLKEGDDKGKVADNDPRTKEGSRQQASPASVPTAESLLSRKETGVNRVADSAAQQIATVIEAQSASGEGRGAGAEKDSKGSTKEGGKEDFKNLTVNMVNNGGTSTVEASGELKGTKEKVSEVYEKLNSGIKLSMVQGGKEVRMSLAPEHLGQLHIKLNVAEGVVKANIIVDSASVKSILDADAGKLKEIFGQNGLVLEKYSVVVSSHGPSGNPAFFSENGRQRYSGEETGREASDSGRNDTRPGPSNFVTPVHNDRGTINKVDVFI